MIKLEQKKEIVAELVELLRPATGIFFVDFSKLSVKETTEIRKEFSAIDAKMYVAKNTLLLRAIAEIEGLDIPANIAIKSVAGHKIDPHFLAGQTAIIIAGDDATAPAKIIKKTFDKTERLRLKAALIEGQLYEGKQLNMVASLPSRAELMSGIIGSLQSPISGIVGSINAVMRDLSSLIEEVAKKSA